MSERIRVVARIVSKPDRIDETRALLEGLVSSTREEPGCVRYELLQSRTTRAEFVTVEEWVDQGAIDAHFSTDHVKAAFAKAPDLLGEAPDIRQYRLLV